jgi:hypothetical protein
MNRKDLLSCREPSISFFSLQKAIATERCGCSLGLSQFPSHRDRARCSNGKRRCRLQLPLPGRDQAPDEKGREMHWKPTSEFTSSIDNRNAFDRETAVSSGCFVALMMSM